jgi:hypothetical protein
MAQSSDEIRAEIEGTREQMGATVDALAYKADVPGRTKEWLGETKETITAKVSDVVPDPETLKRRMGGIKDGAEKNPLGLAIGGAAVGFIVGVLTPSTRMEDERLGPVADEVKSTATDAGREVLERGKHVVQEAADVAMESATAGSQEADELTASTQDKKRDLVETTPLATSETSEKEVRT